MSIIELILIAIGLSMDAFAVSVCKGLAVNKIKLKNYITIGLWFGGFQALMPAIGYFLGASFEKYITSIDHWIAFILLLLIGGNMIKEAVSKEDECCGCNECDSFGAGSLFVLAIATSIDALAVGITFAFLIKEVTQMIFAVSLIGITTFLLSAVGLGVGNVFGTKYKSKAEFAGGVILIGIGLKILLEGIGVL
jgi:putative Mn2+ efflux pump MntP